MDRPATRCQPTLRPHLAAGSLLSVEKRSTSRKVRTHPIQRLPRALDTGAGPFHRVAHPHGPSIFAVEERHQDREAWPTLIGVLDPYAAPALEDRLQGLAFASRVA